MDWENFYNQFRQKDFIPGYEIQVRLGGGAFGDVYKARKQSIGKSYAIKFLKVEDGQQAVVERELAQVSLFAAIDHPNLVTIEDMGVVMGVPYLIMGFAGNQTLAKRLKEGPLSEGMALDYFHQIGRGVELLHERQLVHFDLKPGNIFLQGDRARVGDYGLAKFFEKGNQTLSFGRGTPHYMAPEILLGRGDHRADIYSFGVMLFESLSGRKPYLDKSSDPMAMRQESDPMPNMDGLPPSTASIVERCLQWAPEERFESMGQLLAELPLPKGSKNFPAMALANGAVDSSFLYTEEPEVRGGWVRTSLFVLLFLAIGFLFSLGGLAILRGLIA